MKAAHPLVVKAVELKVRVGPVEFETEHPTPSKGLMPIRNFVQVVTKPLGGRFVRELTKLLYRPHEPYGDCLMCGNREFVQLVKGALDYIQDVDSELARDVIGTPWIIYPAISKTLLFNKALVCGVPKAWVAWGQQGVVACLVSTHLLRKQWLRNSSAARETAGAQAREWLQEHEFPSGIIEVFKNRGGSYG